MHLTTTPGLKTPQTAPMPPVGSAAVLVDQLVKLNTENAPVRSDSVANMVDLLILKNNGGQEPPVQEPPPAPVPPPADPVALEVNNVLTTVAGTITEMEALGANIKAQAADLNGAIGMIYSARLTNMKVEADSARTSSAGSGASLNGTFNGAGTAVGAGKAKAIANKAAAVAAVQKLEAANRQIRQMLRQDEVRQNAPVAMALESAARTLEWTMSWETSTASKMENIRAQATRSENIFKAGGGFVSAIMGDRPGKSVAGAGIALRREIDKVEPLVSTISYESTVTTNSHNSAMNLIAKAKASLDKALSHLPPLPPPPPPAEPPADGAPPAEEAH